MGNFMKWIDSPSPERRAARCERLVERLVQSLQLPCERISENQWSLRGPLQHGYPIELALMIQGDHLVACARAGLTLDQDFVSRRVALTLLEHNDCIEFGSFRVVPLGDLHEALLGHTVDLMQPPREEHLRETCLSLIQEMQQAITRLYAVDLLDSEFSRPPVG